MMQKFYVAIIIFLASLAGIVFGAIASQSFLIFISVIGVLIALGLVFKGVIDPTYEMFVPVYSTNQEKTIYLTFDDGPDPETTPEILDILKKHSIQAVFFLIGHKAEQHPELIQRIVNEGHLVGNHSYSHTVAITFSSTKQVQREIEKANQVIEKACGEKVRFFRPPYGIMNPQIGKAIRQSGLQTMGWDFRSYDTNVNNAEDLMKRVQYKKIGGIVLLHDRLPFIPEFLEQFVKDQKSKNKSFGDVRTLLEHLQSKKLQ